MIYSVKYKTRGSWFWRKIKNVKGDGVVPENGMRYFILLTDERIEIPTSCEILFSRERFIHIVKQMEQEAGQKLPIDTNSKGE